MREPLDASAPETAHNGVGRAVLGLIALGSAALGALAVTAIILAAGVLTATTAITEEAGSLGIARSLEELTLQPAPFVAEEPVTADVLVVDVAGAVSDPGLHRLRPGDRVGDAIEAAGGFAPSADLVEAAQRLNLAAPLADGAKVMVPQLGSNGADPRQSDGRVDLNRAGRATLEELPGIGPVTAQLIIDARAQERFDATADLRSRGIVGDAVFERLKDLVRTGG